MCARGLARLFRAPEGSFAFAVSGTGTSGMETAVANLVRAGHARARRRHRLLRRSAGADVRALRRDGARASTSSGDAPAIPTRCAERSKPHGGRGRHGARRNVDRRAESGRQTRAAIAREHGALTIVDAVTSFGGHPLDVGAWGIDAVLQLHAEMSRRAVRAGADRLRAAGARSGASSAAASISICTLLEDYWLRRKYHHTMSSTLVYALCEALAMVEEEGLEARWARHERNHRALVEGLEALGLSLLPPEGERLWTLNAVRVPDGVDEAAVRKHLLDEFNIEIGAGLGPLAGKIWRVGLMGASSSPRLDRAACSARSRARSLRRATRLTREAMRGQRARFSRVCARRFGRRGRGFACLAYTYLTLPDVRPLANDESVDDRVHGAARARGALRRGKSRGACSGG